ncbi:MAG: hypothetical protein H0X13_13480 [Ramlibacter sp.]|nr:hypothetical protein [Ramlibacter sp.]
MHAEPFQVLCAQAPGALPRKPRLVVAGATGALGNEVLRRLVDVEQFENALVLAREPITAGLRGVTMMRVPDGSPDVWPPAAADLGVILFDPPRLFYDRERALWTPRPEELPEIAQWMRRSGATTLAIVLAHAPGRLPEALKPGLAGLDEQAVAALGFERLLIVRSAQKPPPAAAPGVLAGLAHWMLSIFKYMVPSSEQPVRAAKVAQFVATALKLAPPGIHIAAPETVWHAAQGELQAAVRRWLRL